ncbi:MAG: formyltetrahydrofolate deformylase [Dehalococcoidia bacterium]|nr:formyltetrahydrofolate deformylase [Dehalococcoidia bacterium]
MQSFILTISCKDKPGIVAKVTKFLFDNGFNILESGQFNDKDTNNFFMRTEFQKHEDKSKINDESLNKLKLDFESDVARDYFMKWELKQANVKIPALILISKEIHCLSNIFLKRKNMNLEIKGVISNHLTHKEIVESNGINFHYLPINKDSKKEQEDEIIKIYEETGSELIILARYMQILSDDICNLVEGNAINIHHSFLPGFKGAKPYHQAISRGVKIIGATAHYVTKDLDEGPIIEQETIRVNHSMGVNKLIEMGKDIESTVLSKAIKLHCEKRIFLNDNKTVIFE